MKNDLIDIASNFDFKNGVKMVRPLGEGLINDTFFVETFGEFQDYILQRKNKNIFQNIPAMMDNIFRVTSHLKTEILALGGDPDRESMTVIPTKYGDLYYKDQSGDYWTACSFISDTITYQFADTPALAFQGGKGIGRFQAQLSDMNDPLTDILPGFHNMRIRIEQWDRSLRENRAGRVKELSDEIGWVQKYRKEMLDFWSKVENGVIPIRVTHNDTKISNILFDQEENALCVIDLDTVLNSTCLNDYGDAIRSYTNAGLEDDSNLNNVYVKMDIFEAYTKGYLSEASGFLVQSELDHLVFSAKYITFEQALRFLMDYVNGDSYYKIAYSKHNLVRAHAQYKLLLSIEENYDEMCQIVKTMV